MKEGNGMKQVENHCTRWSIGASLISCCTPTIMIHSMKSLHKTKHFWMISVSRNYSVSLFLHWFR